MKILIDESLPLELKNFYPGHEVQTVNDMNWLGRKNGELLKLAVENGFNVFITVDKNLKYQLNINKYPIGIIVLNLMRTKIETIKPLTNKVLKILSNIKEHEVYEINETT